MTPSASNFTSSPLTSAMDDERIDLEKRLETIRRRRKYVRTLQQDCEQQQALVLDRLNRTRLDLQESVDEHTSIVTRREAHGMFLEYAQRWNVTNDCFHIWTDGTFATINGCRLGLDAPPLPPTLMVENHGRYGGRDGGGSSSSNGRTNRDNITKANGSTSPTATTTTTASINGTQHPQGRQPQAETSSAPSHPQQQQQPQRRYLGLFPASSHTSNQPSISSSSSPKPPPSNARVPWLEVNAALGHACLLLKVLQESAMDRGGGMDFTHELHPMGATSKIGIRFGATPKAALQSTPVIYNLYFEENAGFSFFKNHVKNFNLALQAFVQCIAEAAAQQHDKTIAIPHPIYHSKTTASSPHVHVSNFLNGGEWTIAGLSICYPSQLSSGGGGSSSSNNNTTSGIGGTGLLGVGGPSSGPGGGFDGTNNPDASTLDWTRACKYLLTDLKWLVAYAAKHGDR